MGVSAQYREKGYALIENLLPAEVGETFLRTIHRDMAQSGLAISALTRTSPLMKKSSIELYGHAYPPMLAFLWGLTPMMCALTGRALLPTYDYFRLYQRGDICRLHADRASCEHSLSLTLGYSEGKPWSLEFGSEPVDGPDYFRDNFGDAPHVSFAMKPGDAVLYQGVRYRHGRVTPNPNRWSAHLFLHWVDRDGPYRDHAFDGSPAPDGEIDFRFD